VPTVTTNKRTAIALALSALSLGVLGCEEHGFEGVWEGEIECGRDDPSVSTMTLELMKESALRYTGEGYGALLGDGDDPVATYSFHRVLAELDEEHGRQEVEVWFGDFRLFEGRDEQTERGDKDDGVGEDGDLELGTDVWVWSGGSTLDFDSATCTGELYWSQR